METNLKGGRQKYIVLIHLPIGAAKGQPLLNQLGKFPSDSSPSLSWLKTINIRVSP